MKAATTARALYRIKLPGIKNWDILGHSQKLPNREDTMTKHQVIPGERSSGRIFPRAGRAFLPRVLVGPAALLLLSSGCGRGKSRPETRPAAGPRPAVTAPVSPYSRYQKIGLSPRPAKFYRRWE